MELIPGTRLGPYEVVAPIGAGGMGEVYRAKDTRLGRSVAIKVLSPGAAGSAGQRERFEREARAISNLNHPNICTLYDVGNQDGVEYLVMELLEGETLADRLSKGKLPIEQVLRFGIEIASALEIAHRNDIVHRDLKPGNIMLTSSGVKLLDFGLAKLTQTDTPVLTDAPTEHPLTSQGMVVGTLQYMSPEQLEARPVDERSDIFSLGVVLYEMVTGRRPFAAETRTSLAIAIMEHHPEPVSVLQPVATPFLDRIIGTCLAKDPNERWQSAHDVKLQLEMAAGGVGVTTAATPLAGRTHRHRHLAVAFVLGALLAGGGAFLLRRIRPGPSQPPRYLSLELPSELAMTLNGFGPPFDLSPDGSKLVFVGVANGKRGLFIRRLDSPQVTPLRGTDDADMPFFSPDGEAVAYFANSHLNVIHFSDMIPRPIAPSGPGAGGDWGADGAIVFCPLPGGGVQRVLEEGGPTKEVTAFSGDDAGHSWPELIPGSDFVLFTAERESKSWEEARIDAVNMRTGERRTILDGATRAKYIHPDRLLFVRSGRAMVVPFDPATMKVKGKAEVVVSDVATQPGTGGAFLSVSRAGTILYLAGDPLFFTSTLVWVDRGGSRQQIPLPPRPYANPRISPDGTKVAVQVVGANDDIWIYDIRRGSFIRMTSAQENMFPCWSPDGKKIVVSTFQGGTPMPRLAIHTLDGKTAVRLVEAGAGETAQLATSWSAKGRIAMTLIGGGSSGDIGVGSEDGNGPLTPMVKSRFSEVSASFSPDGEWLTYASNESGKWEVYVQSLNDAGEKIQVSIDGGEEPVWGRNGKEIFFRSADSILAAPVHSLQPLDVGTPKPVLRGSFEKTQLAVAPTYDVTADGQRFLVTEGRPERVNVRSLNIILHRFER